jgi:hypothetical protein
MLPPARAIDYRGTCRLRLVSMHGGMLTFSYFEKARIPYVLSILLLRARCRFWHQSGVVNRSPTANGRLFQLTCRIGRWQQDVPYMSYGRIAAVVLLISVASGSSYQFIGACGSTWQKLGLMCTPSKATGYITYQTRIHKIPHQNCISLFTRSIARNSTQLEAF